MRQRQPLRPLALPQEDDVSCWPCQLADWNERPGVCQVGAAKHPPEDVAEEAQPAPIPIKFIPTVPYPAGLMLNIFGIVQADCVSKKCNMHNCCGNVVKANMIVRLRCKQHLWKNKTTGKNEENTPMETKGVDAWGSPRSLLLISRFLVLLERPDSQLYADIIIKVLSYLGFPKK